MQLAWDYTERAKHYDSRADYSMALITEIVEDFGCSPDLAVADIGAGTGKLTKLLLHLGLNVKAVEPNDAMRSFGIKNTSSAENGNVVWSKGTGEATGLESDSVQSVFFGSSFNVVDQEKCLMEVARILKSHGNFCCLWNHRVLDDQLQQAIEDTIKSRIKNYTYGSRRQDPTQVIEASGLFKNVKKRTSFFYAEMSKEVIMDAWKSHATLQRQADSDEHFNEVIDAISKTIDQFGKAESFKVPYETNAWTASLVR